MAEVTGTQRYSIEKLKAIGVQCASKLPPASTVQAMFLYELQRDCENESLFKSAFFQLGQHDEKLSALETRGDGLAGEIKAITAATKQIFVQQKTIPSLMTAIESIAVKQDTHEKAIVAIAHEAKEEYSSELTSIKEQLTANMQAINNAVKLIAGLHQRLNEHDKALEKQTDMIHCLTVQKNGSEGGRLAQRIEINSIHGRPMELLIPKGNALPALRENRKLNEPMPMTRPMPDLKLSVKNLSHSMHAPDGTDLRR